MMRVYLSKEGVRYVEGACGFTWVHRFFDLKPISLKTEESTGRKYIETESPLDRFGRDLKPEHVTSVTVIENVAYALRPQGQYKRDGETIVIVSRELPHIKKAGQRILGEGPSVSALWDLYNDVRSGKTEGIEFSDWERGSAHPTAYFDK